MSWSILNDLVGKVRVYSTIWGQIWWVAMMLFRMLTVVTIGSSVYGDEQGAFKCDTLQPGCQQVCFNRFSPISHMRFWSFQILFISIPAFVFYVFAGKQVDSVHRLENAQKKVESKKLLLSKHYGEMDKMDSQQIEVWNNTVLGLHADEMEVLKLEKRIGSYKRKQVHDKMSRSIGDSNNLIWTIELKMWYCLHCVMKSIFELVFLVLLYRRVC